MHAIFVRASLISKFWPDSEVKFAVVANSAFAFFTHDFAANEGKLLL